MPSASSCSSKNLEVILTASHFITSNQSPNFVTSASHISLEVVCACTPTSNTLIQSYQLLLFLHVIIPSHPQVPQLFSFLLPEGAFTNAGRRVDSFLRMISDYLLLSMKKIFLQQSSWFTPQWSLLYHSPSFFHSQLGPFQMWEPLFKRWKCQDKPAPNLNTPKGLRKYFSFLIEVNSIF